MRVTIEKMVYGGAGLARTEHGVVFVPKTAPGDVVEIDIEQKKKDYATGRVREIVTPSPDRQSPTCPNFDTAGCCHWQHIRYDRQLEIKEAILRESLSRLGKIQYEGEIRRISGPDASYRLRANFHVRHGKLGFAQENTNLIVPIRECAALAPELNEFIPIANRMIGEATEVHAATAAGQVAAAFVSENQTVRFEKEPVFVEVRGMKYRLDPQAFFQANRFLLDAFVDEVMRQCGPTPKDVLELFCGSGFFTIPLAQQCGRIIGVESGRVAIKHAQSNAKLNGAENTQFELGEVEALLSNADVEPDLVLLNPPRSGAGVKAAALVADLAAPRVVYVSCNPSTFAREAKVLCEQGYTLTCLTLVDQFPNTYHIELVASFDRMREVLDAV